VATGLVCKVIDVLVVGGIFREILSFDVSPVERLGGSGLTAATAARYLGASVTLAGAVGADEADAVRRFLQASEIGERLVVTAGGSGTFAYPAAESPSQPWPLYRPQEGQTSDRPLLPAARVLLLFGIPDLDPVAAGWVDGAAEGATVIWDRQGWLSRARTDEHVLALRAGSRVYVANESEAAADLGADPEWALAQQPTPGYDAALIKRGTGGVVVFRAGQSDPDRIPAYDVAAHSTIGSGDAFAGAVAAIVATGGDLTDGARMGCAIAAAMIERAQNLVDVQVARRARELVETG
jgi:sugar/nucleoside kinase (ribokinase family)